MDALLCIIEWLLFKMRLKEAHACWCVALLCMICWPAGAADWSLASDLSQRVEAHNNRSLDPDGSNAAIISYTTVGLDLEARTKRSAASLSVSSQVVTGFGPGAGDDESKINPGVSATLSHNGKRYALSADASLAVQPVSTTQIDDTGVTDVDATQLTVRYDSDLTLQLSKRSQIGFGVNVSLIDFTESSTALVPTETIGVSANLRHELTQTTAMTFTTGLRRFASDNAERRRSQTLDVALRLDHQRTRRHTFGLSGGLTLVRTKEIGQDVSFDIGLNAGASLDYQPTEDFSASLGISQSVDPSSSGELQSVSRFNSSLAYRANTFSDFGLRFDYTHRTSLAGDSESFQSIQAGLNYNYLLAPETSLSLGHLFRLSDGADGLATGHQIFLSLTHRFTLRQ